MKLLKQKFEENGKMRLLKFLQKSNCWGSSAYNDFGPPFIVLFPSATSLRLTFSVMFPFTVRENLIFWQQSKLRQSMHLGNAVEKYLWNAVRT